MSKKDHNRARHTEIRNAKARHDYHLEEHLEVGIALTGTEVKSIRAGKAQIADAFVRVEKGQLTLYHAHIEEYAFGNLNNHNPVRPRRLLAKAKEIRKLQAAVDVGGRSIVPLRMYFKQALVKLEIAVGTGKKLYDKRQAIRKKEDRREADRALKAMRR